MLGGCVARSRPSSGRARGVEDMGAARGPKGGDLRQAADAPRGREPFDQAASITATMNATIEQGDDAVVGASADEPPEALLQGQLRQRQMQAGEGRLSRLRERLRTRLHDGITRHGERSLL